MHHVNHFRLSAAVLVFFVLAGCAGAARVPSPAPTVASTPTPAASPDLEPYFQGFDGAFVLYDRNSQTYTRYHPEQCAKQLLPASTFKIMNALIGLETGVIPDENYILQWDGTQYEIPAWNRDHSLKTAMRDSVVWYYRELARRVGAEKMQSYVDAVGYGNGDISGGIDRFWLTGALRISADEQVELLKRLYQDDLPFSARTMRIVREILVLEDMPAYRLSGKTGSGQTGASHIGWFVGYLERAENVYFFATSIEGSSPEAKGVTAKEITRLALQGLELLP